MRTPAIQTMTAATAKMATLAARPRPAKSIMRFSLERVEELGQHAELAVSQHTVRRHAVAGLDVLVVANPGGESRGIVGQGRSRQRPAACNMGEIRTDPAVGRRQPADAMAGAASRRDEEPGPLSVGLHRWTALGAQPFFEGGPLTRVDMERHQRVR